MLNIIDICNRWCKLNFGPFQGKEVKSRHFPGIGAGDDAFIFYTNFMEKLVRNDLGMVTLLDNDLELLLPI